MQTTNKCILLNGEIKPYFMHSKYDPDHHYRYNYVGRGYIYSINNKVLPFSSRNEQYYFYNKLQCQN